MVIQTVIADDEALARQKLRILLRQTSDIQVVGEAASPSEIVAEVQTKKPDLLFLDICMPAKNGLDVMAELSRHKSVAMPHIIITTAHGEYAVRAFEMRAADYLLKPYTAERLNSALNYARERIQNNSMNTKERQDSRPASATSSPARIVFKSRGRILFLPITEIRWIAAEENYVRICTGNESHLLRETMTAMESKLDSQMFMRVHRSAIVNLKYVKEVRRETSGDFSVLLSNGQKVAMSRSHHSNIDSLIARL
ncbi:MAG TPA: LytTR family DNA-binding domain-containing protein [Terracidiphilus sp.]